MRATVYAGNEHSIARALWRRSCVPVMFSVLGSAVQPLGSLSRGEQFLHMKSRGKEGDLGSAQFEGKWGEH